MSSQKLGAHVMTDYSAHGLQDNDNPESHWAKVFCL